MGVCCQSKASILYEDIIRESINDLKVSKETLVNFKAKLTEIYKKNKFIEKSLLREYLAGIFYNNNYYSNSQVNIHKRIYEEFINCLSEKPKYEEILLMVFPLLNFNDTNKEIILDEFAEVLFKYYEENYVSHGKLHLLFLKIYEFYTFKLTKIYQILNENVEIKKKLVLMNHYIFTFKNLNAKVLKMLKSLETGNKDENHINMNLYKNNFREKNYLLINDIRDYLLDNLN